jgi:uncharacterized repeat protein (TIGR01451 family)
MQAGNAIQRKYWAGVIVVGLSIALLFMGRGILSEHSSAQGNTYYVAPTGDDDLNPGTEILPWKTIQHAADTMVAGDTVYIRAGTYEEQVIPFNSGSAGHYIAYAAYPGETITIDGAGISLPSWETGLFVVEDKSYIKVSGLRIINAGPNDNNAGIYVDNSHYVIIEDNYTYNTVSSGIGVWDGTNIIIDGNEVRLACNDGEQEDITVSGTDTFEIKNNHIYEGGPGTNGGEGITIKGGATNGKIYQNHGHDIAQRTCLYVDGWGGTKATSNIEIYQNIFHHCAAGITLSSEDGSLVRDIKIYNNIIYDNQSNGLEIGYWGESGVTTRPVESITFINNTVYRNGFGTWGGGFFNENPDVIDIVVRNNIFSQNSVSQIANETIVALSVDHNLIDGYRDYEYEIRGDNYVEGDPMFENPSGADFHLQSGSLAIDSGSSVYAPNDDFEGNTRPQDGDGDGTATHDIGAYEVTPELRLSSATDPFPVKATTEVITYTITLQNSSGIDATGVTITSTVPNSTTYKSGGHSFVDPNVVWSSLAATKNSSINVSFQVTVTEVITNGDRLVNTISASSAQGFTASIPINLVIVGLRQVYLPIVLRNN